MVSGTTFKNRLKSNGIVGEVQKRIPEDKDRMFTYEEVLRLSRFAALTALTHRTDHDEIGFAAQIANGEPISLDNEGLKMIVEGEA